MKLTNEEIQHEVKQEEMFWYYVNKEAEELLMMVSIQREIYKDADATDEPVWIEVPEKQIIFRMAEILDKEYMIVEDKDSVRLSLKPFYFNHDKD